jgi:hypothetical protein
MHDIVCTLLVIGAHHRQCEPSCCFTAAILVPGASRVAAQYLPLYVVGDPCPRLGDATP